MTAPIEDLIERLEDETVSVCDGEDGRGGYYTRTEPNRLCTEAAQALRSLQAEVERLRGALGQILDECPATCETSPAHSMADIARSALNTGSGE